MQRITFTFCLSEQCMVLHKKVPPPDTGPGQSETRIGTGTSFRVTGLRLGRRYRFTIQPTFQNQIGPESSIEERTGYTTFSLQQITHNHSNCLLNTILVIYRVMFYV